MCLQHLYYIALVLLASSTQIAVGEALPNWPDLPGSGFITGRLATIKDVQSGNAGFQFEHVKSESRTPIDIEIPQYAIRFSKLPAEKSFAVIIIQAETLGDTKLVGYRRISDGTLGSALLVEFQLLGTEKPEQ